MGKPKEVNNMLRPIITYDGAALIIPETTMAVATWFSRRINAISPAVVTIGADTQESVIAASLSVYINDAHPEFFHVFALLCAALTVTPEDAKNPIVSEGKAI